MNAQTARQTSAPQTPSLRTAKPETIGLSATRLQRMSDAFKREVDPQGPFRITADLGADVLGLAHVCSSNCKTLQAKTSANRLLRLAHERASAFAS